MPDTVDFAPRPVLVLGASGYIGSQLVAALAANPIYHPIAASRRAGLILDATNGKAMRDALADKPFVVNCIAGSPKAMIRSTQSLCDAARDASPRRIIHLSSMAVYGSATGTVREDQPPAAPISDYGKAKIECERIVRKYVNDGGDAVILRPTCVFGPGSIQWTMRFVRLLRAGRIGDLGVAGDGRCNLAFIDDLVGGIIASLDATGISGRVFNVSSTCDLTWNAFLVTFGKALGAIPVKRISPRWLRVESKVLAPMRRLAGIAVRSSMTEAITPSLVALWQQDIQIDCAAAHAALALGQTSSNEMIAQIVRNGGIVKELVHS